MLKNKLLDNMMNFRYIRLLYLMFTVVPVLAKALYKLNERHDSVPSDTKADYELGERMGVINSDKYSLESFEKDERNIFKDLYQKYVTFNISQPINYEKWLVMNNFGILPDTKESLFKQKIIKRSTSSVYKRAFVNTVKRGDILITGKTGKHGAIGNAGHAAIMISDDFLLEMFGGENWSIGIPSNNRRINKYDWYDERATNWTTVYRFPDSKLAEKAATWAHLAFYNELGGNEKTKHITYAITEDFFAISPSYCSKLVLQSYYYASGTKNVIRNLPDSELVMPITIPFYFREPYRLIKLGRY